MTIPPDLEAQILRYYHVEKWRVGTIARQLHVRHGTVVRVLGQAGLPRIGPPARRSQVEPYLPFIHQTLEKFPTLTASRLYAMVRERGLLTLCPWKSAGPGPLSLIKNFRSSPHVGRSLTWSYCCLLPTGHAQAGPVRQFNPRLNRIGPETLWSPPKQITATATATMVSLQRRTEGGRRSRLADAPLTRCHDDDFAHWGSPNLCQSNAVSIQRRLNPWPKTFG
jgi:hypothetical protein